LVALCHGQLPLCLIYLDSCCVEEPELRDEDWRLDDVLGLWDSDFRVVIGPPFFGI
jgi:hypothetical protein